MLWKAPTALGLCAQTGLLENRGGWGHAGWILRAVFCIDAVNNDIGPAYDAVSC